MGCNSFILQMPHLSVACQVWMSFDEIINSVAQFGLLSRVLEAMVDVVFNSAVTVCPGFHEKYGRKKIVFSQHPHDLPKRGQSSRMGQYWRNRAVQISPYLLVRTFGIYERKKPARRVKKQRKQGHRSAGFFNQHAGVRPDRL